MWPQDAPEDFRPLTNGLLIFYQKGRGKGGAESITHPSSSLLPRDSFCWLAAPGEDGVKKRKGGHHQRGRGGGELQRSQAKKALAVFQREMPRLAHLAFQFDLSATSSTQEIRCSYLDKWGKLRPTQPMVLWKGAHASLPLPAKPSESDKQALRFCLVPRLLAILWPS